MIISLLFIFSLLNNPSPALPKGEGATISSSISFNSLPFGEGWGGVIMHAYHTSLTEANYNPKEKSLEISIRVFTDDLALALTKINNNQKIIIAANDKNDALIEKYIQQHFAIFSPQKQKRKLTFIGKELEGEATWIYLELPDCVLINREFPAGNFVFNNILTDFFADQTNLINFKVNSSKKTFIFNNKKTSSEITF